MANKRLVSIRMTYISKEWSLQIETKKQIEWDKYSSFSLQIIFAYADMKSGQGFAFSVLKSSLFWMLSLHSK